MKNYDADNFMLHAIA